MKKSIFKKLGGLFLGLAMGLGVAVGVTVGNKASEVKAEDELLSTLTFGGGAKLGSYSGTFNETCDTYTYTIKNFNNNNWGWSSSVSGANKTIKGGSKSGAWSGTIETPKFTDKISKVELYISATRDANVTSVTLYSGGSAGAKTNNLGTFAKNSTGLKSVTISNPSADLFYTIEVVCTKYSSNNGFFAVDYVKYYKQAAYTVSFAVGQSGYGTVSQSSITNVPSGTSINTSNNTVTINGTTVTATPAANTAQYTYAFTGWSNDGGTVTAARTITANFSRTTNKFTVSDDITNGSLKKETSSIEYGGDLDVQIVPESGYSYPSEITVTMGGNDITGDVIYDDSDGTILYKGVTGNIVIEATCLSAGTSYEISTIVNNGTYTGATEIISGFTASITFEPNDHYKLPADDSAFDVSHAVIQSYNSSTGVLILENPDDDITVSVSMVAKETYDVTLDLTNVTKSSGPSGADSVEEGEEVTIVFAGSGNYGLPASITVTMGGDTLVDNDDYVWTQETGTLWLPGLTDNLSVTIVGEAKTLLSISFSPTSGSYTLGDDFVKPTVTATYNTGAETVTDTENISYSGYDPYSAAVQTVTISYGGKTATSTYTATVTAASVSTTTYYQKCTSMSDIVDGGKYVLVGYKESSKQYYAMPSYSSGNNIAGATVTLTENETRLTEENMSTAAVYTLTSTGTTNQYYIGDGSQYLYAAGTGTNNHLKGKASTDSSAGAFTISYSTFFSVVAASSNRNTMRFNASNNPPIFSCYANNSSQTEIMFFKEVKEQTGQADLIRITASYTGGEKYVGDPISTSDFAVKKQLNTGNNLIDVASGYTISANTLSSTSNTITVSYTENNITKTADVVVPATERAITLESVTLVQGQGVVKKYIDWSGAAWDYTGLTVDRTWSDASVEHLSLADLITAGNATVSPAKPASGITSFTVSYEYLEVSITNATVSGITVVEDYVTSISWTGTTAAHFKAFSGGQLTAAQVGSWSVVPTLAGAGVQSALSFGQYTLKVGNKTIASLPYTWASEDDGQELSITYGKDENGDDFVKKNNTAVGNICATINAIDHSETISGLIDKSTGWTTEQSSALSNQDFGTRDLDANISMTGVKSDGSTNVRIYSETLRTYAGNEMYFTPSNGAIIKTINLANISATGCSDSEATHSGNVWTIKNGTATITFTGLNKVTVNDDIVVEYQIESEETTTVHYANDMNHFDAQKAVVTFAKFMNETMNGENVCSGTFDNMSSAWEAVEAKYDELFGVSSVLSEDELTWALNMLKYASGVWGSDEINACVEKAMKTYDYCVAQYSMDEFITRTNSSAPSRINPIANLSNVDNSVWVISAVALVGLTAIGGYFFYRKRKEI